MLARYLLALILTTGLVACSSGTPSLPPLPANAVILAFGDSLTAGSGAGTAHGYPATLGTLSGRIVINAGVPGEVTEQGRARLPQLLDHYQPKLLILCHGGNDLLRRLPKDQTVANLKAMIETAQQRGISVVLVGVPTPGLFLSAAPFYEELAEQMAIPYEGEALPDLEGDPQMKSDPIHLNEAGYRRLAEAIYEVLRRSGALL